MTISQGPQIFQKNVACSLGFFSFARVQGPFYIPDCQDLTQIRQINNLAALFSHPNFNRCVQSHGGICIDRIKSYFGYYSGPELDAHGKIKRDPFKNLHVITAEKVDRLKVAICPTCGQKINTLITCPLLELKLRYQDRDINWRAESEPLRDPIEKTLSTPQPCSLGVGEEFLTIHLIFLIDLAYLGKKPQDELSSKGIIGEFMYYDPEYAQKILDFLSCEPHHDKALLWIHQLSEQPNLQQMRADLYSYLKCLRLASYFPQGTYSQYALQNYQKRVELENLRSLLDRPRDDPPSPTKHYEASPLTKEERCIPIRYFLVCILFSFTFCYFFSIFFSTFFKARFLFVEDI